MIINRFIKDVNEKINDPERDIYERLFLRLNIISEITVFIAYIIDLFMGESKAEIITITLCLILIPGISFTCMYKEKLAFAMKIIAAGLVFLILPALFFFGGGLEGGGVLWIIFTFLYIGIVLTGVWRKIFFVLLLTLSAVFFIIDYYHPEISYEHSRQIFYIDSFASIVLIGTVGFFMTRIQNNLFVGENARAKKETERAEELSRSQNRFFSSMSHEIRTPINSILGLNELILRDENASDHIIKDALGIQGSGKMLLSLINDLLDFSKVEAGRMDIVPVDYNVGDLISEVVNMIWLRAEEKGIRFIVTIDPDVPSILYGDEVRIKQVLVNLLNNAVKYTNSGSVELHIESNEEKDSDIVLAISIIDTGIGIKKESLPYLFNAFKRIDEEKNRYIEGTGLGLSIVKNLVELMGGTVNVNSVYGEGSNFTVVLKQGISDRKPIGELNIHNQNVLEKDIYECKFKAPEVRILIVDDNEMNLEVEARLLSDTEMVIDKALSGKEALELTIKYRYDTILMDHLMPEMDGITAFESIRDQIGGLNRSTPIVVLTANAGSANRELYKRVGFDGYLVKPVSGESLENILINNIASDKLILSSKVISMHEDINTSVGYSGKLPVVIASTSMCDLPDAIIKKLKLPILPFLIHTEFGVFKDGIQIDSDELMKYMHYDLSVKSSPPDISTYTEFFARILKKAHHLIYISITSSMSDDYNRAFEAAKSFDNVTVVNSDCISSSTGLLVLIANKLAKQNLSIDEIVNELELIKKRLRCSFVIDNTNFMYKKGLVSKRVHSAVESLSLHPSIQFTDGNFRLGGLWMGSTERAYKRYIHKAFPVDIIPDPEVVFITYADISHETLNMIKEEISKYAFFEHVVFKQASAAISSNCGPGSLGILYFVKTNKSYNLSSYIEDYYADTLYGTNDNNNKSIEMDNVFEDVIQNEELVDSETGYSDKSKWYDNIEGINGDVAIKNSGSESSFETVLRIFYDSISTKSAEIDGYYSLKDWDNYTIKVHALKSSAKLIGALELGDKAQLLENAGKEKNIAYIDENHDSFMKCYRKYSDILSVIFTDTDIDNVEDKITKTIADETLMKTVYDSIREAAEAMDCDSIESIFNEMSDYSIPENESDKFNALKDKADVFDYDGILEVLNDM